jgi:hypothetical protein
MSEKEKTLKERLASLEDEIRSLKFACTRLADIVEQDLKLRVVEEEHLTGIHEILTRMANATITIDPKVLQSIYAMVTNAINDTGLLKTLHKLDDVLYRLSERLKEFSTVQKEKTKQMEKMIKEVEDGIV